MRVPVCPKCGNYWDEEFCEECGHADDSFVKKPLRKFDKTKDKEDEKGKGNGRS